MPYPTARPPGAAYAWTAEAAEAGRRGGQRILHAGEVVAPARVALLLGLTAGSTVVTRRRLIELDDEPVELTDPYYPRDIAAGTPLAGRRRTRATASRGG
ncbi:UTRA domain-containing protein [Streptomyces sp. NPDC090112]|uniref:UTRA domain-containing protein n=1 Tax=Streptomyces sp. NPDC090112 TaxID=3365949 RepID=UPI003814A636